MADHSLQDLFDYLSNWKSLNIGNSPLTYLNPKATLQHSNMMGPFGFMGPRAGGWVTQLPGMQNNITFSRPNTPRDQMGLLELLAHESAHTTQKNPLSALLEKETYAQPDFPYYSEQDSRPLKAERLATLRAMEAMSRKGTRWWEQEDGNEYLSNLMTKNPKVTKRDLIQTVDRDMFPEFQVMHESPSEQSLYQRLFGR